MPGEKCDDDSLMFSGLRLPVGVTGRATSIRAARLPRLVVEPSGVLGQGQASSAHANSNARILVDARRK